MARSHFQSPAGHATMSANLRSVEPAATLAAEVRLPQWRAVAVHHARERGLSWTDISDALAITAQGVHKQYRRVGPAGEIAPPLPLPA